MKQKKKKENERKYYEKLNIRGRWGILKKYSERTELVVTGFTCTFAAS